MNHPYIEEEHIPELYLQGKLSPEDQIRFEEHFVQCEHCLDHLELADHFREGLRTIGFPRDIPWNARSPVQLQGKMWLLLAAGILLLLLPPSLLLLQSYRLEERLEQWHQQLAEWNRQLAQERGSGTASPPPASEPGPDRNQELESLQARLARLSQPQGGPPLFLLEGVRSGQPETARINQLFLPPDQSWILVGVELDLPEFESYEVRVLDGEGRELWKDSGLKPNQWGALLAAFPPGFFPEGNFTLAVQGKTRDGNLHPVARYPFSVKKPGR